MTMIKSGKLAIARVSDNPSLDAPTKYINKFVVGFNSHDFALFQDKFLSMCVPDLRFISRIYGKLNPLSGKPKNPLGDFSYLEVNGIPQVLYMTERFFISTPDGVIETGKHRCYTTNKATVLIATYNFKGTLIDDAVASHISDLLPTTPDLDPEPRHRPKLSSHTASLCAHSASKSNSCFFADTGISSLNNKPSCEPAAVFQTENIQSIGTLAMYLNDDGKVYCVEFFYEYL
jgi:hypothetical protein